MKIKLFTPDNCQNYRPGEPRISFSNDGCIRINSAVMSLSHFKNVQSVLIAKDDEDGQYYLIPFADPKNGFKLRSIEPRTNSRIFSAKRICNQIREDYQLPAKQTNSLLLSSQPTSGEDGLDMFAIINSEK